jgi:hypothetical protein
VPPGSDTCAIVPQLIEQAARVPEYSAQQASK